MELYARIRRAVLVDGMSRRAAAREFGLARKTVSKMLTYSAPPGYQRQKPVQRPKLGPWQGAIDAILEDDKLRAGGPAIDFAIPLVLGFAPFIAFVAMSGRAFPPKPQKARLGWGTLGKRENAQ